MKTKALIVSIVLNLFFLAFHFGARTIPEYRLFKGVKTGISEQQLWNELGKKYERGVELFVSKEKPERKVFLINSTYRMLLVIEEGMLMERVIYGN